MLENPFVQFLRHYGPIPAQDNMYDETIGNAIEFYDVSRPIAVTPQYFDKLKEVFASENPANVILTGTAGDGKTYLARQLFQILGGDLQDWGTSTKKVEVYLNNSSRTLVIVKDLSELKPDEKDELLTNLAEAFTDPGCHTCFLIAANDGQLTSSFRRWAGDNTERVKMHDEIDQMLLQNIEKSNSICLNMYNLSRINNANLFGAILNEILDHPDWSKCEGCELLNDSKCPIQINRKRLRDPESEFRNRLIELLELSASNDHHVPIRNLLLLAVNILLGDSKKGSSPILDCVNARARARSKSYNFCNPYTNAVGRNLAGDEYLEYPVFEAIDLIGIGKETENVFDDLLVYGHFESKDDYALLIEGDEIFGDNIYHKIRNRYLNDESSSSSILPMLSALEAQRRRLFFEIPNNHRLVQQRWGLTSFRYAGKFLELKRGEISHTITENLIKGLNRTFTGMMVADTQKLFPASSGGDGYTRIARFMETADIAVGKNNWTPFIIFVLDEENSTPMLKVSVPNSSESLAEMEVRLVHFEYLMRVSDGSLPSSFSRQCYEEFHGFKMRIVNALFEESSSTDLLHIKSIQLSNSGNINPLPITVRV